jgi:hypothetical protein
MVAVPQNQTGHLAPDPNVKIPAAVQAKIDQANEIAKQVYAPEPQEGEGEGEEGRQQEQQAEGEKKPEGQQPPVTPEVKPEPPKEQAPQEGDQTWEQRYKSAEGRFKAREREAAQMQQHIRQLMAEVQELRQAVTSRDPAPPAREQGERLITPEEEAEYGAEFLDVVERKAQERMAPLLKELEAVKAQLSGVAQYTAQDAQGRMLAALDQNIPDWREINRTDEFKSWLQLADPFSGHRRHDMLLDAYGQNNAARVAAFFTAFQQEAAAIAPREQAQPATPKVPLENLAAPGRARSAAATPRAPESDKPTFSRAEIAQFYADRAKGKFVGREDESQKIERQIFEANNEGRVTN